MKGKYIGLILLVVLIFTVFLTVNSSADVFEVTIPCSYDGTVTHLKVPNTYTGDFTSVTNLVIHYGASAKTQYKAFFEWNISVIPPLAKILNMGITVKGAGSTQYFPNCEVLRMHNLTIQPSLELDNSPGNSNIFNGQDTQILATRGACTVGCGAGDCPYPSTTINTINTTMGGDYWFSNFETNLNAIKSLQTTVPLGWYAIIYSHPYNIADSPTYARFHSDDSGVFTPELWVEYDLTIPESNYSYPADFQEDVGWDVTGINLSMNISHDEGDIMNMTWWAYNESSESFVQIGSNLSVPPGNYNQTWYDTNYTVFSDGFEPCHTYYWKVEVNDSFGNESIFYREFTTYCVEPPTNLGFTRVDNDTLNVTWTKMDNGTGISYTVIYYTIGGYAPPAWGEGTLLCNVTAEYFIADLDEATCYAFSAWTVHQTATNDWYRSINRGIRSACTEGGNFTIIFRDEDTFHVLNFSVYPYNLATFRLKVHYADDYDQYDITESLIGSAEQFNINTSKDIFYLELFVNYDFDNDGLGNGKFGRAQYVRKLLPDAAVNKVFTFYIGNYTVYNEYYYYRNTTGILEQYLDASFQDSVVKYIYSFQDRTHIYDSAEENDAYIEIYAYNQSIRYIVHQELWDAAEKVYPHLVFEKGYLIKVGLLSDVDEFTIAGLAPTHEITQETVVVQKPDENITYLLSDIISISSAWVGNRINVVYSDSVLQTISLTCTIHDLDGVEVYTKTVNGFSEYIFETLILDNTKVYEITLSITHPLFTEIYGSNTVILEFPLLPGITALTDVSKLNILLTGVIGLAPFYNYATNEYINWFEMGALLFTLGIFGIMINVHPPLAFLLTGISMAGTSALVSGFTPALLTVGIIMAILGFWFFLSDWRSGGY